MNPWIVIGWIVLIFLLLAIVFWLLVCGLAAFASIGGLIPLGLILKRRRMTAKPES